MFQRLRKSVKSLIVFATEDDINATPTVAAVFADVLPVLYDHGALLPVGDTHVLGQYNTDASVERAIDSIARRYTLPTVHRVFDTLIEAAGIVSTAVEPDMSHRLPRVKGL